MDYNSASASAPWFTQPQSAVSDANTPASGATAPDDSITAERGVLNRLVNALAGDLDTQSTALNTSLTAILTALS